MKKITYADKPIIQYPVGENIDKAIQFIATLTPSILSNLKYGDNVAVNIWVRGSSGAILGALLAKELPRYVMVKVIHIKKKGEFSHGSGDTMGFVQNNSVQVTNIILDDEVASGATINAIYKHFNSMYTLYNHLNISPKIDLLVFDKLMGLDNYDKEDQAEWPFTFVPETLISTHDTINFLDPAKFIENEKAKEISF